MESLAYKDKLARHHPTLARKHPLKIPIADGNQAYQLIAKPDPNGTFIGVELLQGDTFMGYRSICLLELEQLWRKQNETV